MERVEHGNCYQFDIPDQALNEEETAQVIQALLFDLKRTPVGETFTLDIAIGADSPENMPWQEFVASRKKFKRAEFKKQDKSINKEDVIQFLRENFADFLSLPAPKLKRIK